MFGSNKIETMQDLSNRYLHRSLVLLGQDYRVTRSHGRLPEPIKAVYFNDIIGKGATLSVVAALTYPIQL